MDARAKGLDEGHCSSTGPAEGPTGQGPSCDAQGLGRGIEDTLGATPCIDRVDSLLPWIRLDTRVLATAKVAEQPTDRLALGGTPCPSQQRDLLMDIISDREGLAAGTRPAVQP